MSTQARNILFIHTDSMDGRVMGCMGHPAMAHATPNIDALAARGVLFRNAYSNNPICCPSRASMWSGQFTHHCEAWNNYKGLEPDTPTFRTHLNAAGYVTQTYGKTDHLSGKHTIRARVSPWTRSANIPRQNYRMPGPSVIEDDMERVHVPDWDDVDRSIDWIRNTALPGGRPFMLFLGIRAPHPAFRISRRYLDTIDEAGVTLPPADEYDHPVMAYQRTNKNWMHGCDEKTVRLIRHIYFAMIAEVDAMVGRLLDAVDGMGIGDSTYVIFSSDHGELAMEHRQFYKMSPYEASARVPMILSGPGVQCGEQTEALTSLVDIYPTLMDMAGIEQPDGLDGQSLLPEATGQPCERPDWVLTEFHGTSLNTGTFMIRQGDWKYIAFAGYGPMLFNLKDDPDEIRNLAPSLPDKVREMDALLRSVVDYEAVDAKAKAYDRASFRQWREEQRAAGTYEDMMARVFSGWDGLEPGEGTPWTEADEALIEEWLSAGQTLARDPSAAPPST